MNLKANKEDKMPEEYKLDLKEEDLPDHVVANRKWAPDARDLPAEDQDMLIVNKHEHRTFLKVFTLR